MSLTSEDREAIRQIVREEIQKSVGFVPPSLPDAVHLVQQQALQLAREGKREESIALLKNYSKANRKKRAVTQ